MPIGSVFDFSGKLKALLCGDNSDKFIDNCSGGYCSLYDLCELRFRC